MVFRASKWEPSFPDKVIAQAKSFKIVQLGEEKSHIGIDITHFQNFIQLRGLWELGLVHNGPCLFYKAAVAFGFLGPHQHRWDTTRDVTDIRATTATARKRISFLHILVPIFTPNVFWKRM